MRFASSLPIIGRISIFQPTLLPLGFNRNASRLSSIHHGLRRSERARPQGVSPRKEIRQAPAEEPYLSPEERRRERAIARRNPITYKIRKGKKDITDEPGPPRKTRSARFNDPRDPFAANTFVKKFKTGKLLEELKSKIEPKDGHMQHSDFARQMAVEQVESLMKKRQRRQHEKTTWKPEREDKKRSAYKARQEKTDRPNRSSRDEREFRSSSYESRKDRTTPDRSWRDRDELHPSSFEGRKDTTSRPERSFRDGDGFRSASYGAREDTTNRPDRRQYEFRSASKPARFEQDKGEIRRVPMEQGEHSNGGTRSDEVGEKTTDTGEKKKKKYEPPAAIPYTTAASQFIYGTSTVEAALKAGRRKMYKLYIYKGMNRRTQVKDDTLANMAKRKGIEVETVDEKSLPMMNKMSGNRPHNGYILEASPLPQLPIKALGEVSAEMSWPGFKVAMGYQSREEEVINGTSEFFMTEPSSYKPFVLLLEQVLDPGNLGGILRTASFMGVTAVATSKRGSAPVTPTVLKASAGAGETLGMFSVDSVVDFVTESQEKGWKVYAALPPKGEGSSRQVDTRGVEKDDPLSKDPCILILGSEGEGLSRQLKKLADFHVSIPNFSGSKTVDSLNVSVAAGLLCQAFLRGKTAHSENRRIEDMGSVF